MSSVKIEKNKAVYFTYLITDDQGKLMDQYDLPTGYVHGTNSGLLPKLETSLEGHVEGDKVEITITPKEGFGEIDPELIYTDKLDNVPPEFRHVDAMPQFQNDQGEVKTFTVISIDGDQIIMDGNHPFAGKTIIFIITVNEIRDADDDEISSGKPKDSAPPVIH